MVSTWRQVKNLNRIGPVLSLLIAVVVVVVSTIWREQLIQYASYGYVGIFVACIAANSTMFLPAPSSAVVFVMASVYSPFFVAIVGGLGAAGGEMVGYMAGYSGRRLFQDNAQDTRIRRYMDRYGVLAIFVFAFLPLPLFDLVGVAAGISRFPLIRFLVPCIMGKVLKMFMYAYAGAGILPWIIPHITDLLGTLTR